MAPRLQAGVQPERARLRLLLRLQERLHRLLPAHRRRRPARSVRERRRRSQCRRLHDRPDHRAVGQVHRASTRGSRSSSTSPTTPRTGRTRCPISRRRRVDNARHLHAVRRAHRARARTTSTIIERADQGVGQILAALDRAGPRAQHARDLHQRQRRRVAVAQRAAVPPQVHAVGRRHPRAGDRPLARARFRPARVTRRSASRWT